MAKRRRSSRARRSRSSDKDPLAKYSGYLLLPALYFGWFRFGIEAPIKGMLSALTVFYTMFVAPVPCSAKNQPPRKDFCHNNAKGLLGGCHFIDHKWQNAFMLFRRQTYVQAWKVIFGRISGQAAGLTALAGLISGAAAVVQIWLLA